jgi:predicted PurR-regulated permease PerM
MNSGILSDSRTLAWLAIALLAAWIIYALSPILAPFLAGAILAYILNPLVSRLARSRVRRTLAVIVVLFLTLIGFIAFLLIVMPLVYKETRLLAERLPAFLQWLNGTAAPWLAQHLGLDVQFDLESFKQLTADILDANQQLVPKILGTLRVGGLVLLGLAINLMLIPVVLFYLLRDWNLIVQRVEALVPRARKGQINTIFSEIDAVLAEFLRGQFVVMLVMSVYYVSALWLAGLEGALPIGLITGLLVFIPYIGSFSGLLLATVAALLQFDNMTSVAWVWAAFFLGQVIEGMAVTPLLVGERIGLHPVAVIFALLAFGQLFGFFGVLLALPASAALLVGLRHLRSAYLAGSLYGGPK